MIEVEIKGTGQIAEFPDGTSPEVMRQALARYSQAPGTLTEMTQGDTDDSNLSNAIDIPTAPVQTSPQGQAADGGGGDGSVESGAIEGLKSAALEVMSGVNRGVISLADLPSDFANAAMQLSGSDIRVPLLRDSSIVHSGTSGGFVDDPQAQQALGMLGEFLAPGLPIKALKAGQVDNVADALSTPMATKLTKVQSKAVKQGFGEGMLPVIKNSSRESREGMQEMTRILKRGIKDTGYSSRIRPSDVAGRALLKRVDRLNKIKKVSGKGIDRSASKLKGKPVDISAPIKKFAKSLDDFGVKLVDDGKGGLKADFADTALAPGDRGPIKEVIRQMNRVGGTGTPDAFDAHTMKRIIDRNVSFGKIKTGLSGEAERAMKQFRTGLDAAIDGKYKAYDTANTAYSQSVGALDDIQKAVGASIDLTKPGADKALGTSLRRLFSNAQSRVPIENAINEANRVTKLSGAKFGDDIADQALFADELDRMFGATARTSLKGQTGGLEVGVDAIGRSTAGNIGQAGSALAKKMAGINDENAIKSIDELLRR